MKYAAANFFRWVLALLCLGTTSCEAGSWEEQRREMIERQVAARGVTDPAVLAAMKAVPRHEFVPAEMQRRAYADSPLPIGEGQTISQPYIVALMTELLRLEPGHKVLEIGTGSGYQAAVLHEITRDLYTIEIVAPLHERAKKVLTAMGVPEERIILGDGYAGLPEEAPFDRIIVTAAPPEIPRALLDQLAPGGRMVVPVGAGSSGQQLKVITKNAQGEISIRESIPVRFVPMVRDEGA